MGGLSFVAAASALHTTCRASAPGRPYRLGLGLRLSAQHPTSTWLQVAADRIQAESSGRLDVLVDWLHGPVSTAESLSALRSGELDLLLVPSPALSLSAPAAAISSVGFAFDTDYDAYRALDGELGMVLRPHLLALGVEPLGPVWGLGFRQITSSTVPVRKPEDLIGMKVGVMGDGASANVLQTLRAIPTRLSRADVYSALQDRVVDGQESMVDALVGDRLPEERHLSLTNHEWAGCWLLANKGSLDALSSNLRETLSRVFDDCALEQRAALDHAGIDALRSISNRGMTISRPERNDFRAVLRRAGYYSSARAGFDETLWIALGKYVAGVG